MCGGGGGLGERAGKGDEEGRKAKSRCIGDWVTTVGVELRLSPSSFVLWGLSERRRCAGQTVVASGAKEAEVSVYQGTLLVGCRLLPGILTSRHLHPALWVSPDRGPSTEMRWEAGTVWRRSVDTVGRPRGSVVAVAGALVGETAWELRPEYPGLAWREPGQ